MTADEFDPAYWGDLLCDEVEAVLPDWIRRCVQSRLSGEVSEALLAPAVSAAAADVMPRLRALLAADVDAQRGTPLTILREAVRYPTELLATLGVGAVERDPFAVNAFPRDVYDLSPATWADVDERLVDPGLRWSVAKAHVFKRRHERGQET
jgi:hypothetical protein